MSRYSTPTLVCVHCSNELYYGDPYFGQAETLFHTHTINRYCFDGKLAKEAAVASSYTEPAKWDVTTLVVEFNDGGIKEYPETRFKITNDVDVSDPIVIDGTTLIIENMEQTITLLGVRSFKMEFPA